MICKPGDLAVIIEAAKTEAIGRFVTVVKAYGVYKLQAGDKFCWYCSSNEPVMCHNGTLQKEFICADDCLKPIRGDKKKSTDTSKTKELEKV